MFVLFSNEFVTFSNLYEFLQLFYVSIFFLILETKQTLRILDVFMKRFHRFSEFEFQTNSFRITALCFFLKGF